MLTPATTKFPIDVVGKSAVGNTLVDNGDAFNEDCCPSSVTVKCSMVSHTFEKWKYSVVDTPGFMDNTGISEYDLKNEITHSIEISMPGPHALLIVLSFRGRHLGSRQILDKIKKLFDQDAPKYCIIVFTGADSLTMRKKQQKTPEQFISEDKDLISLIEQCGNRYVTFNNAADDKKDMVRNLFQTIERMLASNNHQFYNPPIYKEVFNNIMHKTKEHIGSYAIKDSHGHEKPMVRRLNVDPEYLDED